MSRTFEDRPAVRVATPLLIGLVGPSGTGKTVSGLRLAHGIRRVVGGEVGVIDTEALRALHYADQFGFSFRHLDFQPPFGPLDYLAAIDHYIGRGVRVLVIDSFSHAWSGQGGVLDTHDQYLDKKAGQDWAKRQKFDMLAWAEAKKPYKELRDRLLQRRVNAVFCFRAQKKMRVERGKDPESRGYQVVGDESFIFELTLNCFLHPGADGVPTWRSDVPDEQANMKLPQQFREVFRERRQLSEDIGQQLAEWAAGAAAPAAAKAPLADRYAACATPAEFELLEAERKAVWGSLKKPAQAALKAASDLARARLEAGRGPAPAEPAAGAKPPAGHTPGVDEDDAAGLDAIAH